MLKNIARLGILALSIMLLVGCSSTKKQTKTIITSKSTSITNTTSSTSEWLTGASDPQNSLGSNGDFYLNMNSGAVFKKESSTWSEVGNLKSNTSTTSSSTFTADSGVPSDDSGTQSDSYLDTDTGKLYVKGTSNWLEVFSLSTTANTLVDVVLEDAENEQNEAFVGDPIPNGSGIRFFSLPDWGRFDEQPLSGQVFGLSNYEDYALVVYVLLDGGGWFTKPGWDYAFQPDQVLNGVWNIGKNGHFSINLAREYWTESQENIRYATMIGVHVFKKSDIVGKTTANDTASVFLGGWFDSNGNPIVQNNSDDKNNFWQMSPDAPTKNNVPKAVVSKAVRRENPDLLYFSGFNWVVKDDPIDILGPGRNYFSRLNVYLNEDSELVLKYRPNGSVWTGAEVSSDFDKFSYGEYIIQVASNVNEIDQNVVAGIFTWDEIPDVHNRYFWDNTGNLPVPNTGLGDTPQYNPHNEIDFEFSTWGGGDGTDEGVLNSQFVTQHWNVNGNRNQFNLDLSDWDTNPGFTCYWNLQPNLIEYQIYRGYLDISDIQSGEYTPIKTWDYTNTDYIPQNLQDENMKIKFNLWQFNGLTAAPSNEEEQTFIIKKFDYIAR